MSKEPTLKEMMGIHGFLFTDTVDDRAIAILTVVLLLYHFGGGELYMLVYDEDKTSPTYKVKITEYDAIHENKEGRTYGIKFEVGDGYEEAAQKTIATELYKSGLSGIKGQL